MKRLEPYWYIVIAFVVIAAVLFGWHLVTGQTPSRVAFSIFGFDIYWYGIWIIAGIAAGAYTVSRLALERAQRSYTAAVPDDVQQRPLDETALPEDLQQPLQAGGMGTLGDVLWEVGSDPARSGLKKPERAQLMEALTAEPDVDPQWLADLHHGGSGTLIMSGTRLSSFSFWE
ncbi:MAG: hypothetical protein R3C44_01090 [Chloroflexota bacterium]